MAAALTVLDVKKPARGPRKIRYKVTLSANYPTNGDVIDFTAATNPSTKVGAYPGRSPSSVVILNEPDGLGGEVIPGVALNDWKLKLWTTADTEHANGAYSANEKNDANFVIEAEVDF